MLEQNIHAERNEKTVLGALIAFNGNDDVQEVYQLLKPEHFSNHVNMRLYKALYELKKSVAIIDVMILVRHLREKDELNHGLTAIYLTELIDKVASPANISIHAMSIYEEYSRRQMINQFAQVVANLKNGLSVTEEIDKAGEVITKLIEGVQVRKGRDMNIVKDDLIKSLEDHLKGIMLGLPSGIKGIDRFTGGFRKTDLYLIAARPGMGKTDLGLFISLQIANSGKKVGFISLEMNDTKCLERLTAMNSGYSKGQLGGTEPIPTNNDGSLSSDLRSKISKASKSGVLIADMGSANIDQIVHKSRELIRKGAEMIVIDYLGLVSIPNGKNRSEGVGDVSRALKSKVAKNLDIPVVALCQLNRSCETRGGDMRPNLSDLRDSGSLEQDASVVFMLYRPEYYGFETDEEGNSTKGLCEIILCKNRHGIKGTVKTEFVGSKGIFYDWSNLGAIPIPHQSEGVIKLPESNVPF